MADYPKPFWAHEENIEKERQRLIRKIEREWTGDARSAALRTLNHLQPKPEPIKDFHPIDTPAFPED
jgi:hypothetical protein